MRPDDMALTNKHREMKRDNMQAECDRWNAENEVGAGVFVNLDGRTAPFQTKTRSAAQILSGHSAVIWLDDVSGCYLLDRVTPIK